MRGCIVLIGIIITCAAIMQKGLVSPDLLESRATRFALDNSPIGIIMAESG